jgi:iron complex transport system substrate-binding protein
VRLRALAAAVAALTVGAAATGCGDPSPKQPTATARTVAHDHGTTPVPAAPKRAVALGEEFLLADVLDLGVKPIASTATLGDHFTGLPAAATRGIEPLDLLLLDLERIAQLRPDLLIVDRFVLGQTGFDRLSAIAPTLPLPDDVKVGWRETYERLAAWLGAEEVARRRLGEYDEAVADARRKVGSGRTVSIATAYPSEIVAWADGPINVPAVAREIGLELVPGPDDRPGRLRHGRASISLERLDLLDGRDLILLQNGGVEGEHTALERMRASPLFARLPAVRSGRLHVLDRLGYPGVAGRAQLASELADLVTEPQGER